MELKSTSVVAQEKTEKEILVLVDDQEVLFDQEVFLEKLEVEGVIRIPKVEFSQIKFKDGLFAHFNLEKTNHVAGSKYVLMPIERSGVQLSDVQEEILPLLSMDSAIVVECVEVQHNLGYDQLTSDHFRYSIDGLGDKEALLARIQERYGASRRDLLAEDIKSAGVGYTLLKFLKKID